VRYRTEKEGRNWGIISITERNTNLTDVANSLATQHAIREKKRERKKRDKPEPLMGVNDKGANYRQEERSWKKRGGARLSCSGEKKFGGRETCKVKGEPRRFRNAFGDNNSIKNRKTNDREEKKLSKRPFWSRR